jgi:hypothetical protein
MIPRLHESACGLPDLSARPDDIRPRGKTGQAVLTGTLPGFGPQWSSGISTSTPMLDIVRGSPSGN